MQINSGIKVIRDNGTIGIYSNGLRVSRKDISSIRFNYKEYKIDEVDDEIIITRR